MKKKQKIYLPFKRLIDIVGSIVGIVVCFVFLWWWVLIINIFATKGHPFFVSERVGRNGVPFKLLKFRTMRVGADPHLPGRDANARKEDLKFGKFLRRSSIDETLQLINILTGRMSFIGPRPLIDNCEDGVTNKLRKENGSIVLRPGISGYAQIHDRAYLEPTQKAEYDYLYLINFSFLLDFKIFCFTLLKSSGVVKGRRTE